MFVFLSVLFVSSQVEERDVPSELVPQVEEKYSELVETVANIDEELGEMFLSDKRPTREQLNVSAQYCTCMLFRITRLHNVHLLQSQICVLL